MVVKSYSHFLQVPEIYSTVVCINMCLSELSTLNLIFHIKTTLVTLCCLRKLVMGPKWKTNPNFWWNWSVWWEVFSDLKNKIRNRYCQRHLSSIRSMLSIVYGFAMYSFSIISNCFQNFSNWDCPPGFNCHFPYRNNKVVTRLTQGCDKLVIFIFGCNNLVTRLLQPCKKLRIWNCFYLVTTILQPCFKLVTTLFGDCFLPCRYNYHATIAVCWQCVDNLMIKPKSHFSTTYNTHE